MRNSIEEIVKDGDVDTLIRVVDWIETDPSIADESNNQGWDQTPADVLRILVERINLALAMRGDQ